MTNSGMTYEVECDLRLVKGGRTVIDPSKARLLQAIRDQGSWSRACAFLGLDEGEALSMVGEVEAADGEGPLLLAEGKERALTPRGERLIADYRGHARAVQEQVRHRFRNPLPTVDGLLILDGTIVLVRRGREPFIGRLALPGGVVEYGETVEDAVVREFREETGLETEVVRLSGIYSRPDRDPRGHLISIAFVLRKVGGHIRPGDDAASVELLPPDRTGPLAFDHLMIVQDFLSSRERSND